MSGTLSGGLGCLCRVFECGCGTRLRLAAQKGRAGKSFRHHIQNVGFQPGHSVLTIDKTRDGGVFARNAGEVNKECDDIGRLLFTLLRKDDEIGVNRTIFQGLSQMLGDPLMSSCARLGRSWS